MRDSKNIQTGADERDGFVTKQDIARRFNRTPRTIEVWMRTGILPYYKVGRSVFFRLGDVERHLEQQYRCLKKPALAARRNKPQKLDSLQKRGSVLAAATLPPQPPSSSVATNTVTSAEPASSAS